MTEQRNLILAIVLSVAIMLGFQLLFERPTPPAQQTQEQPATPPGAGAPGAAPSAALAPGQVAPPAMAAKPAPDRAAAIATTSRIRISTPRLHGSISLMGARVDDLTLVDYRETIDPHSAEIELLSPPGAPHPYYAEFGWVPADPAVPVPGADTMWTASATALTPSSPVTLTWDNGRGLRFVRTFAVDENYMFTVTQRVENTGAAAVTLHPYSLIARTGTPETSGYYILHEGPLGVLDGALKEYKYKAVQDEGTIKFDTTGGWLGITDKYWLTSLVPDQKEQVAARFSYHKDQDADRYQVDFMGQPRTVAPGQTMEATNRLFAGAKQVNLLDHYENEYGIPLFSYAIDFGWFWFLTKPFFYLLQILHAALGNFGLAILALTVVVKLLFFPLANKSYVAMSKMKKLQPEMKKLQERFGDDKVRLNQEMMALYKREKANPVAGCLPMIIQIPVFFALYKVLFVTIEMRHAPFYGWIHDLSAPDPTTVFNLFGVIPFDPPTFLHIGVWPLIMGLTMWLQQKLNPAPADPVQAKMFMFLPIVFTFLLAKFPAGLVIYWAWSNSLSILQQWVIMKRMGVKS